ncbi:hypothetical protein [Streptomyces chrestomyceticus]|uniref:Uncharacterized protein n=1 Tax=Streptomyces chrestomyceticus TaxID=68185 RepID=A0ABU7WL81_9ACTN
MTAQAQWNTVRARARDVCELAGELQRTAHELVAANQRLADEARKLRRYRDPAAETRRTVSQPPETRAGCADAALSR